jgi:CubicO group peptidase (beta-lactamase class C family)
VPYDIRVWTKSEVTGTWVGIHVVMNPEPPHEMRDVGVVSGHHPIDAPRAKPLTPAEAVAAIDAYLGRLAAADAFSGAVLIRSNGTLLYQRAFGMASRRYAVPNDINTKFNIASVTKLVTALAIAQLAEGSKLSFNDPVRRFLPDFPTEATIDQLLTHTSGVGRERDLFTERFARSVSEQVAMIGPARQFAPGTNVRYSNEGYLLLGAIIEKASGESYDDYVTKHIYAPSGMTSSGAFEGDREMPNLATGYTFWRWRGGPDAVFEAGERRNTAFMTTLRGIPSGGTYSTVADLSRLVQALEGCRIVSCAMRDLMLQQHVRRPKPVWSGTEEGYGLWRRDAIVRRRGAGWEAGQADRRQRAARHRS